MEKTEHGKKIYYTMGEVSEMFDVNPSLIRFWEQKFDILKPHKNKKGNRLFTPRDVDNLKLIYHLVKEKGMTLAGAQKRIRENREGVEKSLEVIEKLQGIKALLLEIRQELKQDAAEGYEEIIVDAGIPVADVPEDHTSAAGASVGIAVAAASDGGAAEEPQAVAPKPGAAGPQDAPSGTAGETEPAAPGTAAATELAPGTEPAPGEGPIRPRIIEQTLF